MDTLYYNAQKLAELRERPDVVEMESEAGAITAGWLNHNYFGNDKVAYAQLGYVSDCLFGNSPWQDPFTTDRTPKMISWKRDSLRIALNALLDFQNN